MVKKEEKLNVCVYILYIYVIYIYVIYNIYDNQRNFNTNLILNDIRELLLIVIGRIIVLGLYFFGKKKPPLFRDTCQNIYR